MDERCKEAAQRLHLFLDRELSAGEVAEVQGHLESCPPCQERFQFQSALKRLIHDRVVHESCPDTVKSRLMSSIQRQR